MPTPTKILYVDIDNKRFVQSDRQNMGRNLEDLYWTERVNYQIVLVQPYPAGGIAQQLQIVDVTPYSLQMFVGQPGDPWADQLTWTKDTVNNCFTGQLVLDNATLTAKFTAGVKQLAAALAIHVIESGSPRIIAAAFKLLRPVKEPSVLIEDEYTPPSALVENLALIFQNSSTIRVNQVGDTFNWELIKDAIPAPLGFLGDLRLEAPYSGTVPDAGDSGDLVAAEAEDSEVAGGAGDQYYLARFRVRHNYPLRDYAGGRDYGYAYAAATAPGTTAPQLYLSISEPAQTIHLNHAATLGDEDDCNLDFITHEILIAAGATITLGYLTDGTLVSSQGTVPGITAAINAVTPVCVVTQVPESAINLPSSRSLWTDDGNLYLMADGERAFVVDLVVADNTIHVQPVGVGIRGWAIFRAGAADRNLTWSGVTFINGLAPGRLSNGEVALLEYWSKDPASGVADGSVFCRWSVVGNETNYTAVAITAAGNSAVTKSYHCRHKTVVGSITAFTGTYILVLDTVNAAPGDTTRVLLAMPNTGAQVIEVRNATTGGTLLASFTALADAVDILAGFTWTGSAWRYDGILNGAGITSGSTFSLIAENYVSGTLPNASGSGAVAAGVGAIANQSHGMAIGLQAETLWAGAFALNGWITAWSKHIRNLISLGCVTLNDTPTIMLQSGGLAENLPIPLDSVFTFRGIIHKLIESTGEVSAWRMEVMVQNNGGTCAILTSVIENLDPIGTATAPTCDFGGDDGDQFRILVTGPTLGTSSTWWADLDACGYRINP